MVAALGRPPASAGGFAGVAREWLWAQGFRDEVRVLPQPLAGTFDMHDDGMMEEPVQQRGGDDGIPKNLAPFGEAAI